MKVVCERSDAFASGCAIARAFPTFSRKSSKVKMTPKTVTVEFVLVGKDDSPITTEDAECMSAVAESIRLSARLVDMPCQDMHTSAFVQVIINNTVEIYYIIIMSSYLIYYIIQIMFTYFHQEITKVGDELGIVPIVISGEELNQRGFGGKFVVRKSSSLYKLNTK